MGNAVSRYFKNPAYSELLQITFSFALGILFSVYPSLIGITILTLFYYEAIYLTATGGEDPYWHFATRLGVVGAYILGLAVGWSLIYPTITTRDKVKAPQPFG